MCEKEEVSQWSLAADLQLCLGLMRQASKEGGLFNFVTFSCYLRAVPAFELAISQAIFHSKGYLAPRLGAIDSHIAKKTKVGLSEPPLSTVLSGELRVVICLLVNFCKSGMRESGCQSTCWRGLAALALQ
jgi:hypothetical protein